MTEQVQQATLTVSDALGRPDGDMLVERVLQEIIRAGFANLKADPSLLDDLLFKLDSTALTDVKDFFSKFVIDVRLNFPKDDLQFPMVAILTGSTSDVQNLEVLDHFATATFPASGTERAVVLTQPENTKAQVFCVSNKDSNAPYYMNLALKALFLLNHDLFDRHGMHDFNTSSQDVTLREDMFPELSYARVLTFACTNYFSVKVTERVANKLAVTVFNDDSVHGSIQLNVEDP